MLAKCLIIAIYRSWTRE